MPRLFTALEVPREAALSLSLLRGGLPGARWMRGENYHITLRFIGDIDCHTADELIARVRWHLTEPRAEVFLAERAGRVVGHTIVRVEEEEGDEIGLFSTTYVEPAQRRRGVAAALLTAGERWMLQQAMTQAVTYTAADNQKLISFYLRHGYDAIEVNSEWTRISRSLHG